MDSKRISSAYRHLWAYITLNFMTGLRNAQDCCKVSAMSFECGTNWTSYEKCLNLEQFYCEGDSMLYQIIVISEVWTRAYELEIK